MSQALRFDVFESGAGQRLDVLLASVVGCSRAQVQRWISQGRVRVDGSPCRSSHRLAVGDVVEADPPEPVPDIAVPEEIPLEVLHEDADVIVVNKPAGMVVHPAPRHLSGTLVNALLHHCSDLSGIGGVLRPGIVHRLDRGTSGVLVAAKNDDAHHGLALQFQAHSTLRVYDAFVRGVPSADQGSIDRPIGRHPRDRKRMSVATRSGREARTEWKIVERFSRSGRSHLEIRPRTGRTHQIRVHLSSIGIPIIGDVVYGRARAGELGRPALHATCLGFTHPRTGETMRFEAPLPDDLEGLCSRLRARERGKPRGREPGEPRAEPGEPRAEGGEPRSDGGPDE